MKTKEVHASLTSHFSSSKQARAKCEGSIEEHRKFGSSSIKLKLMNMASSCKTWFGFGTGKDKLQINRGDIVIVEGSIGLMMKLSSNLKQQLCKSGLNMLILTIMGRAHTLNFMLQKLRQK
ncbi:hypothetical protein ACOSQ4_021014 [Xanthoceras sorbifolium]